MRNQGKFNTKLPLADYPFDEQRLAVEVEDTGMVSTQYVADFGGAARDPQMTLPGYDIGERPTMEFVDYPYATQFGDRTPRPRPTRGHASS